MFHAFDVVTNTKGDSLVGYQVLVRDPTTGAVIPIFADDNGTPIGTVSNLINIALTDNAGNYSFFVPFGTYNLEFRTPDGVSVRTINSVPFNSGSQGAPGRDGLDGNTGPANSTYTSLASLKAAPVTNASYIFAPPGGTEGSTAAGTFLYQTANAPYTADGVNIIKLDAVPLTTGALVRQGAQTVAFTPPPPASATTPSPTTTIGEKAARRVDVWDELTPEMKADVVAGTLSVDCGPAFQRAFDKCSGKGQSSLTTGRKLHVPAGRYLVSSPVSFAWRSSGSVGDAGDRRKITIEGDGAANTIIYTTVASDYAFAIEGYATGAGAQDGTQLNVVIRGISVIGNSERTGGPRVGGAWRINKVSRVQLVDMAGKHCNIGIDLSDCINVKADFCEFTGNNLGMRGQKQVFSYPNVWRIANTSFGGSQLKGVEITKGANVTFDTCGFEGIGTSNAIDSNCYSAHLIGGPAEGGASAKFTNCYFEGCYVAADIRVEWGDADGGSITVESCSFQRLDSTLYARRHMLFSQVSTGKMDVILTANKYKIFNSYVPGTAPATPNPSWEVTTANVFVDMRGESYVANELPQTNGWPCKGVDSRSTYIINNGSASVLRQSNVSFANRTSLGVVDVTFKVPYRETPIIIPTGQSTTQAVDCVVAGYNSGACTIKTYVGGALADVDFTIDVDGRF
ncbi:glycosyl hydrolase family 28-related protein [Sphingomonas sp. DC1100-1]|uniref:glycosyl hydrolase family 28-related protein n=1 Tax=unclassified Sphingomonas TaxID=196159 RepID=UPI003CFAB3EA